MTKVISLFDAFEQSPIGKAIAADTIPTIEIDFIPCEEIELLDIDYDYCEDLTNNWS